MHHVDLDTPWDEIWQAMDTLIRQGKVVYVGSSNFAGWNLVQAQEAARARHRQGLVSEQSLYNLIERRLEMEVIPAAREYGIGIIPWSPLMRGALGGILRKQKEGRSASESTQKVLNDHRGQIERYEALCDELGHHPADVGIAWLLAQPGVTAPIIGPAPSSSWRAASMRSTSSSTRRLSVVSTRSSPRSVQLRRPTRGDRQAAPGLARHGQGTDQGAAGPGPGSDLCSSARS